MCSFTACGINLGLRVFLYATVLMCVLVVTTICNLSTCLSTLATDRGGGGGGGSFQVLK